MATSLYELSRLHLSQCALSPDQQFIYGSTAIDPTFSLGDFSVTCITYRHLLVTDRRTGESPVMLGRVFVHQKKAFESYHFFASSLISLVPSLDKLLAFGTDGEEPLQSAFRKQFKFAIILRCFRHLRQNIRRKLVSDMGVKEDDAQEILSYIFGIRSGPTLFEGLVDADDECQFEAKLAIFKDLWANICEKEGMSFYSWFVKFHANTVVATNSTCCWPW